MVLLVVAIWGFNFVFIRIGLNGMPPLLLCTLRFGLASIPAVFLVKRPKCSWGILASYGLVMFALQFSFLFCGMKLGMPPSLASLVMQLHVFFTMGLAAWIFGEKPSLWKITGAAISFSGVCFVAFHTNAEMSGLGLALTLCGALAWGFGNIISKKVGQVTPLALVAWGSLTATPVLLCVSLAMEGPALIAHSLQHLPLSSIGALAYIVYLSTHVAYSLWSYLLHRYPTSTVAPFTLLVPVFGFLGSALFLGETLPVWKIEAGILVIAGLCFNLLEGRAKAYLWRSA